MEQKQFQKTLEEYHETRDEIISCTLRTLRVSIMNICYVRSTFTKSEAREGGGWEVGRCCK